MYAKSRGHPKLSNRIGVSYLLKHILDLVSVYWATWSRIDVQIN